MGSRFVFNGKEVTNPVAKLLLGILGVIVIVAGLVVGAVVFLVLPLVGVAITLSIGAALVIPVATVLGILLFMLGGAVLGVLVAPFIVLAEVIRRRRGQ